jgi:hypothetical protein
MTSVAISRSGALSMSGTDVAQRSTSTTNRQRVNPATRQLKSCRFKAFSLWPTKKYGSNYAHPFQDNAYMRRTEGVYAIDDSLQSNDSYVTIMSDHLGLYGAVRLACDNGLGIGLDIAGNLASLAGLLLGILFTVLVVTGLTYMLASTLVGGAVVPPDEVDNNYVERDFFGRGQIRLNVQEEEYDGDVSETSGTQDESGLNILTGSASENGNVGLPESVQQSDTHVHANPREVNS